jgi:hypothetical protein
LEAGAKSGVYLRGTIRVNANNLNEAYVRVNDISLEDKEEFLPHVFPQSLLLLISAQVRQNGCQ